MFNRNDFLFLLLAKRTSRRAGSRRVGRQAATCSLRAERTTAGYKEEGPVQAGSTRGAEERHPRRAGAVISSLSHSTCACLFLHRERPDHRAIPTSGVRGDHFHLSHFSCKYVAAKSMVTMTTTTTKMMAVAAAKHDDEGNGNDIIVHSQEAAGNVCSSSSSSGHGEGGVCDRQNSNDVQQVEQLQCTTGRTAAMYSRERSCSGHPQRAALNDNKNSAETFRLLPRLPHESENLCQSSHHSRAGNVILMLAGRQKR